MIERATVTSPEMIGLLAWWIVVLGAPVILLRRWRRRGRRTPRLHQSVRRLARAPRRHGGATTLPGQPSARVPSSEPSAASPAAADRKPAADQIASDRVGATPSTAPTSETTPSESSPSPAPPLSSRALEPLGRYVDFQRRLELAASELRARLAQLPAAGWRIEPYPLTGERRNTLLILGETGIFVLSATYAPGHWDDVVAVSRLAGKIQLLLPGYGGPVRPAICHPFTPTEPRIWHREDERGDWVGAWLVGGDSVIGWLTHFGPRHGLSAADLARFDELAKPSWLKGAIPTAPSWPQIRDAPSPGAHG